MIISVKDSGTGMDKETKQRIFEPFFTTKISENSFGMGMSRVYGIISSTDTKIEIQSRLGKGTEN